MKDQNEQHKLSEINRPMNEELFNNLEKQYQELAKVKAESEQIEKQAIEEIAKTIGRARGYGCRDKDICKSCLVGRFGCIAHEIAQILYQDGYRKQSEWISVDERLPSQKETVLVYDETGDIYTDIIEFDGKWSKEISRRWGIKYFYWMPLPEAPKMKGGAE